jgi:predicted HAD superfamily Cof-like phosphohydrolase
MYHNKEKLATHLYEVLDDVLLGANNATAVSIDKLLTNDQKYSLIMHIIAKLPATDLERVQDFHSKFMVQKEHLKEHPHLYKYKDLRFNLLLEEVLELGTALGLNKTSMYSAFMKLLDNVPESITMEDISINKKEVLDALIDILFVANGAIDVFNFSDVSYEAMEEVYSSNMTKLINEEDVACEGIIKQTVKHYQEKNIPVISLGLKNGYIAIVHLETGKILKPVTYVAPDLLTIIKTQNNE